MIAGQEIVLNSRLLVWNTYLGFRFGVVGSGLSGAASAVSKKILEMRVSHRWIFSKFGALCKYVCIQCIYVCMDTHDAYTHNIHICVCRSELVYMYIMYVCMTCPYIHTMQTYIHTLQTYILTLSAKFWGVFPAMRTECKGTGDARLGVVRTYFSITVGAYGVATISRLLKIIGLLCKRAL